MTLTLSVNATWASTNVYHLNRRFEPCPPVAGAPTVYNVIMAISGLTEIVQAKTNVIFDTNNTYAAEYESLALGYGDPVAAWAAVLDDYAGEWVTHSNKLYDNVGWVKGGGEVDGTWAGYLWLLQNHAAFRTSPTNLWVSPAGKTNLIEKVLVGTIGDYAPMQDVVDVGPTNVDGDAPTNFAGSDGAVDVSGHADFTAYYKLLVIKVDLDGDNEDDGDVDDDDDAVEATLPVIVAINEDTRELTVRKVGVSSGGTLKIKKTGTGKITLKKPGGTTVIGENDAESVDILPDAGTADLVLTLDGIAVGDVELELEFASGSVTCSDPFKVKVVRSDVVQRSGNTFLAALIGEARTHSGVDWEKYVTDLYDPGIERTSLATFESLADGGPDKKRLRVKKTLYMARRAWAKVYDNMDAQAYTLPTSVHPWNLFTTSTNYSTANCNELIREQFRRAIAEVRGELTNPAQLAAFESTWYTGGSANPLTAGKHLVLFPGKSPTAGPTIFLMETALNYRAKCVGATTQFQNDYEGEILIFFNNGNRYTAGPSCSICGAGTNYPSAPWYVVPFLELWDEAHHSTITPDSFVDSSFFEEITY